MSNEAHTGETQMGETQMGETMSERHARLLAAFAERAARLAADLADRALEAQTPEEAAQLSQAFHAVGRSLRQAIALEQRLEREAARAQREDAETSARARTAAVAARKRQLRGALRPLAYTECEAYDFTGEKDPEEAFHQTLGGLLERVELALETAALDPEAFLAEPLPAQVERLAAEALADDEAEDDQAPEPPPAFTADPAAPAPADSS